MVKFANTRSRRAGMGQSLRGRQSQTVKARYVAKPRRGLRGSGKTLYNRRVKSGMNPRAMLNIAPGVGGQTSFSHKFRPDRRALTMEKVGGLNQYSVNQSHRIDVASGFQNALCLELASAILLRSIMGTLPLGQNKLNQYALRGVTSVLQIANNSSAGAHIDIYDIVYKRSTPESYNNMSGVLVSPVDALSLWRQGLQDQDVSFNVDAWKQLLCKPTAATMFRDYAKVLRCKRILLGSGSTHEHRVRISHNKVVSTDLIAAQGQPGDLGNNQVYAISGYTYSTLVVAYGTPCSTGSDIIPGGEGSVIVSTAPLAIDVVQQNQYDYTWVYNVANTWRATDNLSSFAPGAGQIVAPAFAVGPVQIASP